MTSVSHLLRRIFGSSNPIRLTVRPFDNPGCSFLNNFRLISNSNNLTASKSNETNGTNANYDEDGFDVAALKEEEKEKLKALKNRLSKNEYYEKYKNKLIQAQRSSPQVFGAKAEQVVCKNKKPSSHKSFVKKSSNYNQGLFGILNTDVMESLDKDDIIYVWKAFNENRGKIGDSMPGAVYSRIASVASTFNMFIFPLPRNDGYEFFLSQFSNNVFHFTPLVSYQVHGENSPISLVLANYTEMQSSKDLVLIMAEYNKKLMSPEDINIIYTQLLFYYAYPDDKRMLLLTKFTEMPTEFNHMDLITEYELLNKTKLKT